MWRSPGELVREHLRLSVDFRIRRHQHVQLSTDAEALLRENGTAVPRQHEESRKKTAGRRFVMKCGSCLFTSFVGIIILLLAAFPLKETRADPGRGRLLGTNASGGSLLGINTTDGSGVVIGFMGVGVTPSLATDPITGTVYVATGGGNPVLFTVDPARYLGGNHDPDRIYDHV
jgi:hypothetical protein